MILFLRFMVLTVTFLGKSEFTPEAVVGSSPESIHQISRFIQKTQIFNQVKIYFLYIERSFVRKKNRKIFQQDLSFK